ncbi:ABC transporter ATP-binding protein [Ureibacillus sp. NPDC094379]
MATATDLKLLLQVKNVKKFYTIQKFGKFKKGVVKAVNDVSFNLYEGETYGLVGESGCGKSTLGKTLLQLEDANGGEAIYKGKNLFNLSKRELRNSRRELQMVFQDPYSSLNPKINIGKALEEPLVIHGIGNAKERTEKAIEVLKNVGLQPEHYFRLPHELSGGQRQRIGLARALILNPKIVICDEPVSALDVIIQSQIINLMRKIQRELNLTYLIISHDIGVVRHISDRIGVMYLGNLVEEAETDEMFENPLHPYTQVLLSAVPSTTIGNKKERIVLNGELPSPLNPPSGCKFHERCPFATTECKKSEPIKKEVRKNHFVACHLYN